MKNLRAIVFLVIIFLLAGQSQIDGKPPIEVQKQSDWIHSSLFPEAGQVRIVRDTYGLPHIFAANETDVMYGLGYATADELKEIYRRIDVLWGKVHCLKHGGREYPLGGSSYHMVVE